MELSRKWMSMKLSYMENALLQLGEQFDKKYKHNSVCFTLTVTMHLLQHTEIYSALSTHYSQDLRFASVMSMCLITILHRVLDTHYPEFASKKSFLLQILSSTMLHDSTNSLYVLYQFVLRRPLFNAGGRLLPDLIDFYKWLHEEMTYCVTEDNAQKLSIGVAISTVLNSYSPAMRDRRHEQFNRVKCELSYLLLSSLYARSHTQHYTTATMVVWERI